MPTQSSQSCDALALRVSASEADSQRLANDEVTYVVSDGDRGVLRNDGDTDTVLRVGQLSVAVRTAEQEHVVIRRLLRDNSHTSGAKVSSAMVRPLAGAVAADVVEELLVRAAGGDG